MIPSSPNTPALADADGAPGSRLLRWVHLGRLPYHDALALQLAQWEGVRDGTATETVFSVEHDPVITLGRRGKDEDVLLSEAALRLRGVELVRIDRGGEATWHGPGQLVLYPIIHVQKHNIGVSDLVRGLAASIREELAERGIDAVWNNEHPGLWVDDRKIAAVGMRIQGGVSRHGAALNVDAGLDGYALIVPCGMPGSKVTSMLAETGRSEALETLAGAIIPRLAARFGFALVR